jgi:hypothetical protein
LLAVVIILLSIFLWLTVASPNQQTIQNVKILSGKDLTDETVDREQRSASTWITVDRQQQSTSTLMTVDREQQSASTLMRQ